MTGLNRSNGSTMGLPFPLIARAKLPEFGWLGSGLAARINVPTLKPVPARSSATKAGL